MSWNGRPVAGKGSASPACATWRCPDRRRSGPVLRILNPGGLGMGPKGLLDPDGGAPIVPCQKCGAPLGEWPLGGPRRHEYCEGCKRRIEGEAKRAGRVVSYGIPG